jgi:uncharacterized membrane protein
MKTIAPLVAFLMLVGFSCRSAREVSYKTLATTAHAVDVAMQAYADARVAGKVDDETHAKVSDIKRRYEKAFLAAATAAQVNLESPTPTELIDIAAQLLEVLNAATKK